MHTMHLLPSVAIQPNLELKTQPKQLLGSLLLVITLPGQTLQLILPRSEWKREKVLYNLDYRLKKSFKGDLISGKHLVCQTSLTFFPYSLRL
jgi:hypothetical protein